MGTSSLPGNFKISPKYTVKEWIALQLDPKNHGAEDWKSAVAILRDRIEGRFFTPADTLIAAEDGKTEATFGFAILALDFLIVETIEGFRHGLKNHNGKSQALFQSFLGAWPEFLACVPPSESAATKADHLYKQGRCALHHSGATDKLRVGRRGDMVVFHNDGRIDVNRTEFHKQLRKEFDRFLAELGRPEAMNLRTNVLTKMTHICGN
ncbi:MAG: hypothetical protein EOQ87_31560 [Mesorhizobium sp.]|nr:MAG: hypothetical protein EOQ87_31560 [Mesorhizobium sp.]